MGMKSRRPANRIPRSEFADTIFFGGCQALLRKVPDASVDLVVSSPPYNLGKEYEAKQALELYLDEQRSVLTECIRVLRPTGSLFWQVGAFADRGTLIPLDIRLFPILESLGMKPRNRIIWIRQHGVHGRKKFSCRHESILWFTKTDEYVFNLDAIRVPQKYRNKRYYRGMRKGEYSCNPKGKNPGDIWIFRNVKHNHEEQTIHPCQFPEDLIARIVLATTHEGDHVLDPYMGSGTVAVVARNHGRRFLGAEIDAKYHDVAVRRLSGMPNKEKAFPNLKTLREFVDRTGEPIEQFRFDVQVGSRATDRSKAKIYPEEYHLQELERRLHFEEVSFSARRKGESPPQDYFAGGKLQGRSRNKKRLPQAELPLFNTIEGPPSESHSAIRAE